MATPKKTTVSKRTTPKKLQAPEEVTIDIDSITWDEIEAVEGETGWVMEDLFTDQGRTTTKGIKAFLWLELRKTRPDVTIAEVGKLPFTKTALKVPTESPTNAG